MENEKKEQEQDVVFDLNLGAAAGYGLLACVVIGLVVFFSYGNTAAKEELASSYSGSVQQAYDNVQATNSGALRLFQASKNACERLNGAKEALKTHKVTMEDVEESKVFCESIKYANDHMPSSETQGEGN